ncbi:aminotransferase class I/II-fold pyridoxal phosphate-dependent enzyme [Haloimpatiens lingqiaonensis]|uniref:aminotransferase class I/II-fold pyridoxal phosphate-dependent enzyme n=1 Tax=Haloimpatiens lingqiaonensis TaxID=1380675 RepID=UPI0010FDCF8E|nr:aminotransferase class I/II-fold pyridoxal phosphate-dependent enzyme [Haloimpatiens lingqiaonensis]
MKINNRLYRIGNYEFKAIGDLKRELIERGKEIIDLSIGDPNLPLHENIVNSLMKNIKKEGCNKYPPYDGEQELKKAVIKYYKEVYGVNLNMDEVVILIGSKEGISKIIPAVCDTGDSMIITDPAYPAYLNNAHLWGVVPEIVPLKREFDYLPDIKSIPKNIISKSKLFMINYPNNPTGALANEFFYKELVNICYNNNIVLCNDNAYGEIIRLGEKNISLLQFDKEKQCIEFGTMSKTYNMTGFRIAYVVGNSKVLKELLKVKAIMDSGQYIPIQLAAVEALKIEREYIYSMRKIYDIRRETAKKILKLYQIEYYDGNGAFYIWCKTPKSYSTHEFCKELMYKCNLIVTPGYVFGNLGYDYFRIALTEEKEIIEKGLKNLKKMK